MSNTAAELQRGMSLYQQGRLDEALATYDAMLRVDPKCAGAWHGLGMIAIVRRDHDRALDFVSKALDLDPTNPTIHMHAAVVQGRRGQFDVATRHYHEVIRLAPGNAEAYFNLSRIVRFEIGDPLIDAILLRLGDDETTQADSAFLHFAAGKYFDDTEQHEQAFLHYRDANAARDARFDAGTMQENFRRIETSLTSEWLRKHGNSGNASSLPVFIVGMPRSGTSLVEQILSSHPAVVAGGELPDMWQIVQAISQRDPHQRSFPESLTGSEATPLDTFARAYVQRLANLGPTAERVTNKNPTDFRYLGLIACLFPNARILHVQRDPRDTCLSCYFQNFRNGQEYSFDLRNLGLYYRSYSQLMAHWQTVLPTQILNVRYETLVTDPESVIREMLEHCGLGWDAACLEPHKTSSAVSTASRWQVRNPINRSALGRWKQYEQFLDPLFEALDSGQNVGP